MATVTETVKDPETAAAKATVRDPETAAAREMVREPGTVTEKEKDNGETEIFVRICKQHSDSEGIGVLFFGITAAGACRLMGWRRVCFADRYEA